LVSDAIQGDVERFECAGRQAVRFAQQTEQQIFGTDVVVVEQTGNARCSNRLASRKRCGSTRRSMLSAGASAFPAHLTPRLQAPTRPDPTLVVTPARGNAPEADVFTGRFVESL
jgi:hypothetical protein